MLGRSLRKLGGMGSAQIIELSQLSQLSCAAIVMSICFFTCQMFCTAKLFQIVYCQLFSLEVETCLRFIGVGRLG